MSLDRIQPVPHVLADTGGRLPLVALEAVRTLPVERAVFSHAKVIGVVAGRAQVETPAGRFELVPGDVLALGAGVWCSAFPAPFVRTWTIYADEEFLRAHVGWLLPPAQRLLAGVHPSGWDGVAARVHVGPQVLRQIDPLIRQMSLISTSDSGDADTAASRLMALFARTVELGVPALLDPAASPVPPDSPDRGLRPLLGRLRGPVARAEVRRAGELLRSRMDEVWTVERLAGLVALSPTHLGRLFTAQLGLLHGLNRPGFSGGSRSMEDESYGYEVQRGVASSGDPVGGRVTA